MVIEVPVSAFLLPVQMGHRWEVKFMSSWDQITSAHTKSGSEMMTQGSSYSPQRWMCTHPVGSSISAAEDGAPGWLWVRCVLVAGLSSS